MQTIDEVKAHCRQVLFVALALCMGVAIVQADPSNLASAGVDSRGTAFGKKVKGDLGERMMDDFYTSSGYEKVDCSVGVNGADGVYVTRNADGTIDNVIVSESKTDTAQLGRLDSGTGPYQGSQEYYLRKIDEKIRVLEKEPRTPEVERMIKDLKQIRRKIVYGDYRSRLFRMNIEVHNGKTYMKMQTSELVFDAGPNARPTATARGRPAMIDMTSPDSELSPYYRARRKQYYTNLKDELIERMKKGGYGISKPLTKKEAQKVVDELKAAYESGGIRSKNDLISKMAKECGVGVDEAEEIVAESFATKSTSASKTSSIDSKPVKKLSEMGEPKACPAKVREVKVGGKVIKQVEVPVVRENGRLYPAAEYMAKNPGKQLSAGAKLVKGGVKQGGKSVIVKGSGEINEWLASPAGQGVCAGTLTFLIKEGEAVVAYADGSMEDDEFHRRTAVNAGVAVTEGASVYGVATILEGAPAIISIGAFIGVSIVIEQAGEYVWYQIDREVGTFPGISVDELLFEVDESIRNRRTLLDDLNSQEKGVPVSAPIPYSDLK